MKWPLLALAVAAGVLLAVLAFRPEWMLSALGAVTGTTALGATIGRRQQRKELDAAVVVAVADSQAASQQRADDHGEELRQAAETDPDGSAEPPGMTPEQRASWAKLEAEK